MRPHPPHRILGMVSTMIAYLNHSRDAAWFVIDVGRTSLTRVDGWFISDTVEGLVFIYK